MISLVWSANASAAIVPYTDFASFQAAASGVGSTITFEMQTVGDPLVMVDDVSFFIDDGELIVRDTNPTFTISPTNYVGDDIGFNFSEGIDEFQTVSILFDNGRSAVGLWVQYDGNSFANDGLMSLTDIDDVTGSFAVVDPNSGVAIDTDQAFFLGLVETNGTNTIFEVDLLEMGVGGINYTFDNVVSYQVAAIPEPSTFAVLAVFGGAIVVRQRRRNKAQSAE
ncbi:hypothetical protein Poly51_46980 [Rubripirellula tenax]|uniref:PEP-CTERM protein-sorting domain-containing protein n=1 Tax=Rubripirellula tenax TaxID=2528015 RepID=A0A5C6EJR6_9BACT|nr:PEP-CTERM sorting domain-containing protein [Rubripirellula tenax]TWU48794.1 hypothetical protein Poly51_46980 [Rubripirellula tenax]